MIQEVEKIIQEAKTYLKNCDEQKIIKAYEFAKLAHEGQKRFSGEPYITHPVEACKILMSLRPDTDTICACFLHDVPEDTPFSLMDVSNELGESVAKLVEGLIKLSKVHPLDEMIQVDNLRKMFLAMAKDLRVVLIKFSDRLHNLRTLHHVPKEKQKRIARESLEIYAAIAARLGIYSIKTEIEDICFQYLYPKEFVNINEQMQKGEKTREDFIQYVQDQLLDVLGKENIKATVNSRIKHNYSVFKKLRRKSKNYVDELYDIVALRVILKDKNKNPKNDFSKCYTTLGTIHKYWTPLTHRFKDYIALPKDNGYQSLHTTVIGLGGKNFIHPTEIQIRTENMHFESEFGIAAHWQYKDNNADLILPEKKQGWIKNLITLHQDWQNNEEFLENLKIDIFKDRIFILTPRGDVKDLPQGATPIDFAYNVHSEIGHRFKGAIVNDSIVPLDYQLKNGDVVKIITKKEHKPNLYWLSSVVTNTAKNRIKSFFKSQDKDNVIKEGKALINKQLERYNLPELPLNLSTLDAVKGKKLSMKQRMEMLEQVGNGAVSSVNIVKKIIDKASLVEQVKISKPQESKTRRKKSGSKSEKSEILIKGEDGYETRIAGCCNPSTEDNIVGFITKGRGIAIHKNVCPFITKHQDKESFIEASWSNKQKSPKIHKISIEGKEKNNLLKGVIEILNDYNIDIHNISTIEPRKNLYIVHLAFKHSNFNIVNKIFDHIEGLSMVRSVRRE